jgi:hypothetical protein
MKAIPTQMKNYHLRQDFIGNLSDERGCLGSCRTGYWEANIETESWLVGHSVAPAGCFE